MEEIVTVIMECRECKGRAKMKIPKEDYINSPLVIYCSKCNDFTIADVIDVLEEEEKLIFYRGIKHVRL